MKWPKQVSLDLGCSTLAMEGVNKNSLGKELKVKGRYGFNKQFVNLADAAFHVNFKWAGEGTKRKRG